MRSVPFNLVLNNADVFVGSVDVVEHVLLLNGNRFL